MRNNTKLKKLLNRCEITLSMDEDNKTICMVAATTDDPVETAFVVRSTSITDLLNQSLLMLQTLPDQ
jgi:hypothetical protein